MLSVLGGGGVGGELVGLVDAENVGGSAEGLMVGGRHVAGVASAPCPLVATANPSPCAAIRLSCTAQASP